MRTIRPPKKSKLYTFTCRHKPCQSIVEAALCELLYEPGKNALDDGRYIYKCPHCGTTQELDEADIGFTFG